MYRPPLEAKMVVTLQQPTPKNEHQRSVHDFLSCIVHTLRVMEWRYPIISLSAAFMAKDASDNIATTS